MESEHNELVRPVSRYYQRKDSNMAATAAQHSTEPEFTYHFGEAPRKKSFSAWRRSYPEPLPEPARGLVFHIYRSSAALSRKAYNITLADRKTTAFYVSFPYTAFGLSSKPNILVQRGGSSGPVVGEVRYHSWNTDEIMLPLISSSVAKLTTDGFFKKGRKIRLDGKDWLWRQVSNKLESGKDGVGESEVNGRWKAVEAKSGAIFALVSRTAGSDKVGRIAVTQDKLDDKVIEALVVCAVATLEKEERSGSISSSDGD